MRPRLRYAYNQILRGMLAYDVPYVLGDLNVASPTAWSDMNIDNMPNTFIDFKTNWPGRGIVRMFSHPSETDADITYRFFFHYDSFMRVGQFGNARLL